MSHTLKARKKDGNIWMLRVKPTNKQVNWDGNIIDKSMWSIIEEDQIKWLKKTGCTYSFKKKENQQEVRVNKYNT